MLVYLSPSQLHYLQFLEAHHVKEELRIFITQNQAYTRFGRNNVQRWVKTGKVIKYQRPTTVEYKLHELLAAAENQKDYEL